MRGARLAAALWAVLVVVVWNVVFDRAVVLAGRRYVHEASVAARVRGEYIRIDDRMVTATRDAVWAATRAAGAVAVVGGVAMAFASRRVRRSV